MACGSVELKGIGLGCKDHTGGIKEVYLAKEDDFQTIDVDPETNQIRDIQMKDSAKLKTYRFRKGTSDMTSTASSSEENGTFSVQTAINLQFNKMETSKRMEIMALCIDSVRGVVRDNNDKYWFVGKDSPLSVTSATGATGKAYGDFGGYNITLTDDSKEFPFELSTSAVNALKTILQEAPVAS